MDFLANYGLFFLKSLTLVVAIIIVAVAILGLAMKNKHEDGELNIKKLNDKYKHIKQSLESTLLDKKALKTLKKSLKKDEKKAKTAEKPRLFVLNFHGDIKASEVKSLRESVSAILTIATPKDEVVAVIESPGGMVHSYGLAASQLARFKSKQIPLTTIVDKVAASGGYMMACVGDKILSAPFAVIGSIGVVAQLPNFHKLLEKHDIDVELHTAGEYKRTLTLFGKNTAEGRKKFQEELEETHTLFKQFVAEHRPQLDINRVANGEHWYGLDALKLNLVDGIAVSDDYLMAKLDSHDIFEVKYEQKQKMADKLGGLFSKVYEGLSRY